MTNPQEMRTVQVNGKLVETVEAQKEVFFCDTNRSPTFVGDEKKVDLVIFTKILENLNDPSNPTITKTFIGFRCVTVLQEDLDNGTTIDPNERPARV